MNLVILYTEKPNKTIPVKPLTVEQARSTFNIDNKNDLNTKFRESPFEDEHSIFLLLKAENFSNKMLDVALSRKTLYPLEKS
jgi:hypothetical protein